MRVVVLRKIPEDEDLRLRWNALVERVEQPQVFFTYEWALAVQRAYSETLRPWLFLGYDSAESLYGVAALAATSPGNEFSFLCATTGDYCDFISLPEHRMAFVDAVFAELKRELSIGRIVLTNLPADSATVGAIREAARKNRCHCFVRTAYQCAQISLESLRRTTGGKPILPRKKMLRRSLNAMGREGPVRLDHGRSWNDMQPFVDEFILAHVARFLRTQRISNLARPERRRFLQELSKLLSEPGWIVLTRMMSNDRAIAWNYGFQFHGTWFWYQPTFDCDLEKYSPGFCLLGKIIEEAVQDSWLKIVDLGLGAEEYKERFSNQTRETLHLTLQKSAYGHLREILRYRVATVVKASPKLDAGVRSLQHKLTKLKDHPEQRNIARNFLSLVKLTTERLWGRTEVFFYEASQSVLPERDLELRPLEVCQLAAAAIEHVNDEATLTYLLRSAQRVSSDNCEGFALVDGAGRFLHFSWITSFREFVLSQLNADIDAPSNNSFMLFDYWTPPSIRGRGYCAHAIESIARRQMAQGKKTWTCTIAANTSAVRAIEKAGVHRRYSLVRQRMLWWQKVRRNNSSRGKASRGGVGPSVATPKRMRVLLVHPEDSPRRGPWSAKRWDLIVDLGRSSEFSADAWSSQMGCSVLRSDSFRNGLEDIKLVRQMLCAGEGRLLDDEGIDWWNLTFLLIALQVEAALILRRVASQIDSNAELWATRADWLGDALAFLLGRQIKTFSENFFAQVTWPVAHYGALWRRLSSAQIKEIFLDKYDPGYEWRSRFASSKKKASEPVVLIPSAYGNASRMAVSYARMLPDQDFLLIATRRSGKEFEAQPNVQVSDLASYATSAPVQSESARILKAWGRLRCELCAIPEFDVLSRAGVLDSFPNWIHSGLRVRNAWRKVLESEPVCGVLCGDDSNLYTRLPVLLAARRNIPTLDFHHGAMDGRYLLKDLPCDTYLAKNAMERDYLLRVCGLPPSRVLIGAAVHEDAREIRPLRQASSIIFFSEPYENMSMRAEEVYREILPSVCRVARENHRNVLLKLHPFESLKDRKRVIRALLEDRDLELITVLDGPLSEKLLLSAWFGLTVESTTVMDCLQSGVPCFLFGWLRLSSFQYAEQYARFGVGEVLHNVNEVAQIPARLADGFFQTTTQESFLKTADPQMLRQCLTARSLHQAVARQVS